jgi:hypothetical protein
MLCSWNFSIAICCWISEFCLQLEACNTKFSNLMSLVFLLKIVVNQIDSGIYMFHSSSSLSLMGFVQLWLPFCNEQEDLENALSRAFKQQQRVNPSLRANTDIHVMLSLHVWTWNVENSSSTPRQSMVWYLDIEQCKWLIVTAILWKLQ